MLLASGLHSSQECQQYDRCEQVNQDPLGVMGKPVPVTKPEPEPALTDVDGACTAASFPHAFHGIQCDGFSPLPNASTAGACAAACCAQNRTPPLGRCQTW